MLWASPLPPVWSCPLILLAAPSLVTPSIVTSRERPFLTPSLFPCSYFSSHCWKLYDVSIIAFIVSLIPAGCKLCYFVHCCLHSPITSTSKDLLNEWTVEKLRNPKFPYPEIHHIRGNHPPLHRKCVWDNRRRGPGESVGTSPQGAGVKLKLTWLCVRSCAWIPPAPQERAGEWLHTGSLRGQAWKSHRPGFKSGLYHFLEASWSLSEPQFLLCNGADDSCFMKLLITKLPFIGIWAPVGICRALSKWQNFLVSRFPHL